MTALFEHERVNKVVMFERATNTVSLFHVVDPENRERGCFHRSAI